MRTMLTIRQESASNMHTKNEEDLKRKKKKKWTEMN